MPAHSKGTRRIASSAPAQTARHPDAKRKAHHQVRGALIAFEGLDGSGKGTQIELLQKWLEHAGFAVTLTRWNSSALVGPTIRRGRKDRVLRPLTSSLLQAADLAERLYIEILPALDDGHIVLINRYIYTALARDAARGQARDWLRHLYRFAPKPDLCFYLRLPMEAALDRILSRRKPKYHEAGMDLQISDDPVESYRLFQARIVAEYDAMIEEHGLEAIDATQPIQKQQDRLRRAIRALIHSKMGGRIGLRDAQIKS